METSQEPAVVLAGVGRRQRRQWIVRGIDLDVPRASLFALIGKSGAGKTTTLRLMLGLLRASEGRVEVLGTPAADIARCSGRIAVALDPVALHPHLSVRQNLRAHAAMHGRSAARLDHWLERLDLGRLLHRKASRLSQGESQRVNLARALLLESELLVLDEPLVHLDPASAAQALQVLVEEVRERGATIVLSSHHLAHVERSADRVAFVHGGRVLLQGSLGELLATREPWYRILGTPEDRTRAVLDDLRGVIETRRGTRRDELLVRLDGIEAAAVNAALHDAGIRVSLLAPEEDSLDALFQRALEDADRAGATP